MTTVPRTVTGRARAGLEIGLALALTLGAIGAGYVAGRTSAGGLLARPAVAPSGEADTGTTHAAEARMEGLLLLLLGRGGVL